MTTKLESPFAFQQEVIIDGDASIRGVVTGMQFRMTREPLVEVSYFHNGDAKAAWVEVWRLSPLGERRMHFQLEPRQK